MAGEMVGGSFLSAFLQVLFDRMSSGEVVDFFKGQKVTDRLLKRLNATMKAVNAVLDDAEEKQNTKPAVKEWLDELKDAVYEADDLLDEIAYEALRFDLEARSQTSTDKVWNFLSSLNPFKIVMEKAKLEEIIERLIFLAKQKDALGLREGIGEKPSSLKKATTSLVDESGSVYGRDDDKELIVKMLLSDDANGTGFDVIPIVGMGGLGKTTLAQLVYNDSRVQERFDLKAWVCVSEEFDVFKITKDILKEIASVTSDVMTPNQLQLELKEKLMGKKLLLVLDDIWNDKYDDWEMLQKPLKSLAQGSKIIVTTRNVSVASVMGTVPTYHLKELSNKDCWLLFVKHAFDDGNSSAYPDLEVAGREMVRKCKGLPLAAKMLGCLLSSRKDAEKWGNMSKSNMWDLSNDNIVPALRLSYHYLPSYLKPCFAYCAIFPKDYEFKKEELILLWMAEGFLVPNKGNKQMEEIGDVYFHDLVSRSFFQPSSSRQSYFVMHDLINDLAKFVSGEFCFWLEGDHPCKIAKKTRHLAFARAKYDASKIFEALREARLLRTFLPTGLLWGHIDNEVMHDLLPTLGRLRVLSLSQYNNMVGLPDSVVNLKHLRYLDLSRTSIENVPDIVTKLYQLEILILHGCGNLAILPHSIGNLKHLRYLNLHGTSIERLPESVIDLYNLQTLILYGCENLLELPINMATMINLCRLDIQGTKLQEMPPQMGKLTKLQELTDFVVGKHSGSSIKELGKLQHLQGDFSIWNLQNVVNSRDALEANLKVKKHLKKLKLRWDGETENSGHERGVLDQLQPHVNVECLSIVGYGSTRFPDWVGDSSFSNLTSLKLSECNHCLCLPPLGQLASLKQLSIKAFDGVMVVGPEFYSSCSSMMHPFRSLEILRFERMLQWCNWISIEGGAFPLLQELYIRECPNLTNALPSHLPSLTTLVIEGCQNLVPSFPKAPAILGMKLMDNSRDVVLKKSPSGLNRLTINRFHSLDSLLEGMELMGELSNTLEEIEIKNSNSLKCFPLERFPKLKDLCIRRCPNLESLSATEVTHGDFTSLQSLEIKKCPNLVSFPRGGLRAPNLTRLQLRSCSSLKFMPECMHSCLTSLVSLKVDKCPELDSFPEGGLPPTLESLEIRSCNKLIAGRTQWDLQNLPSLSCFRIGMYKDLESFPEEGLLPSTLTSLEILNLQNLKSLRYNGLQQLTSLRELTIAHCPKLQSLPEEGLPSSLFSLVIYKCPLLEQRCRQEQGEDWAKICLIPHIEINLPKVN